MGSGSILYREETDIHSLKKRMWRLGIFATEVKGCGDSSSKADEVKHVQTGI